MLTAALAASGGSAVAKAPAERATYVGGASVVLPVAAGGLVEPGERVTVRVKRNRSGHRAVVSLLRVDGRDRLVARDRFRRGTFAARVTRQEGARYRLRLRVGVVDRVLRFVVRRSNLDCLESLNKEAAAGRLSLGAQSGPAGSTVPVTLVNDGGSCLFAALRLEWQALQADGSYVTVGPPPPMAEQGQTTRPGERTEFSGTVWERLSPGTYRAAVDAYGGKQVLTVLTSEPFEVTP